MTMNSRQRRKLEAARHNEIREAQKVLEQDRIDNPEKYQRKRRVRGMSTVSTLTVAAMAMSPSSFK